MRFRIWWVVVEKVKEDFEKSSAIKIISFLIFKLSKKNSLKGPTNDEDEADEENDEDVRINSDEDLKEIENEIISNRADALLASNLAPHQEHELKKPSQLKMDQSDMSSQRNIYFSLFY